MPMTMETLPRKSRCINILSALYRFEIGIYVSCLAPRFVSISRSSRQSGGVVRSQLRELDGRGDLVLGSAISDFLIF